MSVRYDFAVRYNPETDSEFDIFKRIVNVTIIKRLYSKKPTICFLGGDSGEGKSMTALYLQWVISVIQNINLHKHVNDMNVYTPLEYPQKLERLLFNKDLKNINVLCMHEAREVVKAKNWNSFLNTAIADVNAMSRSVKRLVIMVVSQFIRDISKDIRYTLNYYMTITRNYGEPARLNWQVLYKDDKDLENPQLRKRKLRGYLILPDGRYVGYSPAYFNIDLPPKDIIKEFEKSDLQSKKDIIRGKLNKLINEMELEQKAENSKIIGMVDYYTKNLELLGTIGKRNRIGNYNVTSEFQKLHDLTPQERKKFQTMLNDKLKKLNVTGNKKDELEAE